MTDQHTTDEVSAVEPAREEFDFAVAQDHKWYRRADIVVPVVLVVAGLTLLATVGGTTQRYRSQFAPGRDVGFGWDYFFHLVPQMLTGLYVLARATILGFTGAIVLGFFMALGRRSRLRLVSWPVAFIVEFIRSTPLLVQLFFLQALFRATDAISLGSVQVLVLGLALHYGTYTSEGYRAGINSVPKGQWEASTALNLSPATKWLRIIIPQAVPNVLPALGNNLIASFKDAPMGGPVLAVPCMLFFANTIRADDFRSVEPMLLIGAGFLLVSIPAAWGLRKLERRIEYERE
jgi:polar amino acid transport system permease protein